MWTRHRVGQWWPVIAWIRCSCSARSPSRRLWYEKAVVTGTFADITCVCTSKVFSFSHLVDPIPYPQILAGSGSIWRRLIRRVPRDRSTCEKHACSNVYQKKSVKTYLARATKHQGWGNLSHPMFQFLPLTYRKTPFVLKICLKKGEIQEEELKHRVWQQCLSGQIRKEIAIRKENLVSSPLRSFLPSFLSFFLSFM